MVTLNMWEPVINAEQIVLRYFFNTRQGNERWMPLVNKDKKEVTHSLMP
jgi:hypothetical protein